MIAGDGTFRSRRVRNGSASPPHASITPPTRPGSSRRGMIAPAGSALRTTTCRLRAQLLHRDAGQLPGRG
jgi:hypothetical protein